MEWVNDEEAVEMNPTCDCGVVTLEEGNLDYSFDGTLKDSCWGRCSVCGRGWEWTRVFRLVRLEDIAIKREY